MLAIVQDYSHPEAAYTTEKLEIFDGLDIEAGPVAAIRLREATAPGLHGSWTPRLLGPDIGERLPAANDIRESLRDGKDSECAW